MSNHPPTRTHRPAAPGARHASQPPRLLNRIIEGLEAVPSRDIDLRDHRGDRARWDGSRGDLRQLGLEIEP